MDEPIAIVLAAGKSKRIQSDRPKVLHPLGGRPMIEHVLEAVAQAGIARIILVVGHKAGEVRSAVQAWQAGKASRARQPALEMGCSRTVAASAGSALASCIEFAVQHQQLGTGHAVRACGEALHTHDGPVIVLAGDQPLIRPQTIRRLVDEFSRRSCACVIGSSLVDDPAGLGRIIRDRERNFLRIVEQKDATAEEATVREVNVSCYVFDARRLWDALQQLRPDNAQKELLLTDCPNILRQQGHHVVALPIVDPREALGVNTPEQWAYIDRLLQGA